MKMKGRDGWGGGVAVWGRGAGCGWKKDLGWGGGCVTVFGGGGVGAGFIFGGGAGGVVFMGGGGGGGVAFADGGVIPVEASA